MMTGTERFRALMNGDLPDRVPVVCNLLEQGARELGISIEEYYSRGDLVAEGQLKLRERYGYDVLWGFLFAAKVTEFFGVSEFVFSGKGPPNTGVPIITNYRDIENLPVPENISSHPSFAPLAQCIKILKRESNGRYPVLTNAISSFSLPSLLMGMERWMDLIVMGPAEIRELLLEKCIRFTTEYIKALRSEGGDMVVYASPHVSPDVITHRQFHEMALPVIKEEMKSVGTGDIIFFNGGGRINPIIDTLIVETGIGIYYINPHDSVSEAKKIIAGRGISTGIINDIKLIHWTREEIETEVKRIMLEGAPGGGFIFGTMMMPFMIPEENIKIMLEAAYEYGEYQNRETILK